jgi:hypothetical protein
MWDLKKLPYLSQKTQVQKIKTRAIENRGINTMTWCAKARVEHIISPSSLVFHEAWALLEELCGFPKDWPAHCAWRKTLLPVPHFIPP